MRSRKDSRGADLISHALPFGHMWYGEPNAISHAIGYAKHRMQKMTVSAQRYFSTTGCFASSASFSNCGLPRSESQNGINFSWP